MSNIEIVSIKIDGYANLDNVSLDLGKFNALVALNNFGKSNLISGIEFGVDFIKRPIETKKRMMAFKPVIPINKTLAFRPFSFEIEIIKKQKKEEQVIKYGYAFDWVKNDKSKGRRIKSEFLKVKTNKSDSKYKTYVNRTLKDSYYMPSPSARCDKHILIEKEDLLLNKLKNFDDLFYIDILKDLNNISVIHVDTLRDPDKLFRTIEGKIVHTDYSLEVPRSSDVGFFIYSLMKKDSNLFELFKDSIKSLLPSIEDFECLEIDLKKHANMEDDKDIPLDFPEKLYEILVKEGNNNQNTSVSNISSGSQKIFFIVAMAIAAEANNVPAITLEEIENSIHPGLLQKLLMIINSILTTTKIIVTSHSPYLIKYLDPEKIRIGLPNPVGTAQFKKIRKTKIPKLNKRAQEDGVSMGDIIFDAMIDSACGQGDFLNEICE